MTDRLDEPVIDGPDMFGRWHVRYGRTHVTFDDREEAENAACAAPVPPARAKRALKIPPLDSKHLTSSNHVGFVLRDAVARPLGCVVGLPNGAFALWVGRRRVGEYGSASEAEAEARKVERKGRRSPARSRGEPGTSRSTVLAPPSALIAPPPVNDDGDDYAGREIDDDIPV